MQFLYWIFLGISPAVFAVWYIYKKDKWEPEPKWQVTKIFMIGILAIIPAGLVEVFVQKVIFQDINYDTMAGFSPEKLILNAAICFLAIAPVEELFKYSVVKAFIYHREDFNEKMDGVVYMVAAAMGFSAFENIMYIIRAGMYDVDPTQVGIMRGLLATPAHAIFSGFLGVYLGRAKFAKNGFHAIRLTVIGFLIAIFLHGLYNTLIFTGSALAFGVVPLLLIAGFFLMRNIKQLVDESPFKPKPKDEEQAQPAT